MKPDVTEVKDRANSRGVNGSSIDVFIVSKRCKVPNRHIHSMINK